MSSVPDNAPEHCPGTASTDAGKSSACAGCPNQNICATGAVNLPDPDLGAIQSRLAEIGMVLLVLSGKGGVGKSTVTGMLARALYQDGTNKVGVLDVDIHGPSQARVFGVKGESVHISGSGLQPVWVEDSLGVMSTSFLLESDEDALIWRGSKKNDLIKKLLRDVCWGPLDYLVLDTPPGTSDEHLTLAHYLVANGVGHVAAVLVTTPQEVALLDVRKEITFCRKVKLPILGIVENMTSFVCPSCKFESVLFPANTGGGAALAEESKIPLLGRLPLDGRVARCCDEGLDFLALHPDSPAAVQYHNTAQEIRKYKANLEASGGKIVE